MYAVSVIIPVFNRPRLLEEAARSVFAQSFGDWELIIVDDGSSDATAEAVKKLCENHSRASSVRLAHTGLPGLARNRGAERSRGRYIAFLDSDDLWLPEKLRVQLRYAAEKGCPLTHTREKWLRDGREISQRGQKHRREGDIFDDALKKCIIGPSTAMIERKLFFASGGFDEELEIAEDYEFWLRLCARSRVGYIDAPLTVKRAGHAGQLSEKFGHIEFFRIKALESLLKRPEMKDFRSKIIGTLLRKYRIYLAGCRKRGRLEECRGVERKIFEWEREKRDALA